MKAGLIWFTRGFVEYQFPNNAKLSKNEIESMEFSMELSSEVPGTYADWPSDITVAVNGKDVGTWTSPGDLATSAATPPTGGSSRAASTQLRLAHQPHGTYVDGSRFPGLAQGPDVETHHSIRLKIGVKADARHLAASTFCTVSAIDQDIVLRRETAR
jgi:predicted transcriptional regulator